ncbi:DUF6111 family protein [Lichenihabitans sp. Uapishka_5]|uniref:DUF6111 family protein n=1 Tax=Lichenihabitans sp. Uapishka_5 TaxID=3037302 RepID=UPI0029E7F50B|nr:DUF6111 family protein [Lichenihabitans sp. Uapishka_5]MDX7950340.1 DUF6111 family protein [Lichenihabitans sp. Uapishka_5]
MIRITLEGVLLLLLPFAVYAALLLVGPRLGLERRGVFGAHGIGLMAAGVALVVLALLALGLFSDRARGPYVPAHIEDGRLVPGRMR